MRRRVFFRDWVGIFLSSRKLIVVKGEGIFWFLVREMCFLLINFLVYSIVFVLRGEGVGEEGSRERGEGGR